MNARAYWIDGPWPGRLAIIPRPRGGDWLSDEVAELRESGIDTIVSFLTQTEVAEFDLEKEGEICRDQGVGFISFPILDRDVPASKQTAAALLSALAQLLTEGKNVGLHCRQSVGRSSIIAAALLVAEGEEPRSAFDRIGAARGCRVPETIEQEMWVAALAQEFSPHPAW